MDLGHFLFRNRSYTPIPFLLLLLAVAHTTLLSFIVGLLIVALGEGIRIYSVGYSGLETRATRDVGAPKLVTGGPYSIVRNPIYLGNMTMYLGFGVMSNVWWIVVLGLAWFLFQYTLIVKREEGYLRQTFGQEFERYTQNVPRFLPRIRSWAGADLKQTLDVKLAIRSERRSFQSLSITAILILVAAIVRGMPIS
jgi:protein-S-isoprenylcysteine O-methyltransferase Ste14